MILNSSRMKLIRNAALVSMGMMAFSSCSFSDNLQPCPEPDPPVSRFTITFTQNMEFEDQFADQVHCIDVYLFNHGGTLVYEHHQEKDTKSTRALDNEITLDLAPGYYDAVVYGGLFCTQSSFDLAYQVNSSMTMADLQVALNSSYYFDNTDETGDPEEHLDDHSILEMHDYFYGVKENFYVSEEGLSTFSIDLERNTNVINLKIYNDDYSNIDINDYRLYIVDDNNTFDTGNDVTESGLIAYRPYSKSNIVENEVPKALSSFTVSKLYKNSTDQFGQITPELVVINKVLGNENPVVDHLDLMPYLLAAKDAYTSANSMSDDEFLRRNYTWDIEMPIDAVKNTWISITIKVGDWQVRFDNLNY